MQYPLNDTDDESDKDSYSKAQKITERPRKIRAPRQPIIFALGSNNDYTIITATPDIYENQKTTTTENNVNKILENMENRFHQTSENLQRKQETQLNAAFEQIQHTLLEFNKQPKPKNWISTEKHTSNRNQTTTF